MKSDAHTLAAEVARTDAPAHLPMDWPGNPKRRIALVVLGREQIVDAQIAAVEYLVEKRHLDAVKLALLQPEGLLDFEREVQTLSRAIRDPDSPDLELFSADELRAELRPEVQRALIEAYNAYEKKISPLSKVDDPEALKEYLRSLKANGGLLTLVTCSGGDSLRNIAHALVDLWLEQPSASSSVT